MTNATPFRWSLLVALLSAAAVILVWRPIVDDHRAHVLRVIDLEAERVAREVQGAIHEHNMVLTRLASSQACEGRGVGWEDTVRLVTAEHPGFQAIAWIDPSLRVRRCITLRGERPVRGDRLVRGSCHNAMELSSAQHKPGFCVSPSPDGEGILICVPIIRERFAGYLTGLVAPRPLLEPHLDSLLRGHSLAILDGHQAVYEREADGGFMEPWSREAEARVDEVTWRVRVCPGKAELLKELRWTPEWILAVGLSLSALLGGAAYLAQSAHLHARAAEKANASLLAQIAERERAERALAASEARYRTLAEAAQDNIFILDPQLRFVYINPYGEHLLGCRPDEAIGTSLSRWMPRRAVEQRHHVLQQVLETGEIRHNETDVPTASGTRWLDTTLVPLKNERGEVTGIMGVGRDVTERRRLDEALQQQRRLTDAIFDNMLAFAAYLDREFHILRVNATLTDESQRSAADLVGQSLFSIFPLGQQFAVFQRVRDTGEPYVARAVPFVLPWVPERGPIFIDWTLRAIRTPEGVTEGLVFSGVDVTASEHARLEVERLIAELTAANTAKDQFLAVLSHELRNPLAPILAAVDVLRPAVKSDPSAKRALEILEHSTKLQSRLINDLLDLSRITRGKIEFHKAPVPLDAVLRPVIQAQEESAAKADLALHVDVPSGCWVNADPDRMQQAVLNLVANAVKFTPPEGEVWVRLERSAEVAEGESPGRVRITVEDTGIGISPALIPCLFDMFRQGETSGRHTPGLGIGLALTKQIVERHDGRVWAESEGLGKGSRFIVELPLIAPPEWSEHETGAEPPATLWTPDAPGARAIRLLIVEDNLQARAMLAESLMGRGYDVRVAASGEAALERLAAEAIDLILSDIDLPGMDGYELMRRVRQMPGLGRIGAFAITGFGYDADVHRAREAGFALHLVKPVDVAELDQRIRAWLARTTPQARPRTAAGGSARGE